MPKKSDTDQPPMSKSVVKRLQAQGAEPVATKPVQTCADCRHELWLDLENRCKHLIPVEVDEMYHETRCGHKCEIPAEGGGEVELLSCPLCYKPMEVLENGRAWCRNLIENPKDYSEWAEGSCLLACHSVMLPAEVWHAVNAARTSQPAQPSPTPTDEVNRRAWQPIGTHPTHDDDVLLLMPDGDIVIGFWRDDAKAWDNTESGWIRETPARWASLPELPPDFTTDVEQGEKK